MKIQTLSSYESIIQNLASGKFMPQPNTTGELKTKPQSSYTDIYKHETFIHVYMCVYIA